MDPQAPRIIRIAAALIDNEAGQLLLVRKNGTPWFMQAGGKIEDGESALAALRRELGEEIGLCTTDNAFRFLGCFSAPAANEPGDTLEAIVFHVRIQNSTEPQSEIEEAVWVLPAEAATLPLAPLTRDYIIPLAYML
jgi:8-oxo-dGTP pyrophosphatase MutT (NUDIX family)